MDEKKPYSKPTLQPYGDVKRLTLGRRGSGNDESNNVRRRRPRRNDEDDE